MDNIIKTNTRSGRQHNAAEFKSQIAAAGMWVLDRLPAVAIIGLIALYYVQLSHMGA